MKNRHSFYLRYVLSLFVFLFLLSFITDTGIGQEFPNQSGLKAQIGEGGKLAKQKLQRIREAIRIQKMNTEWLLDIAHVVGTATGIGTNGEPEIRVFAAKAGIRGIPENLDGFSVKTKVTGRFYALDCPNGPTRRCDRPVPIGVSTGHPDISAGTIGARVTDGTNVYALSNNHVYAAINSATIGDSVIQPGTSDGGSVENDFIGRLADFEPIQFCQIFWIWLICNEANTIDAAIVDVIDPDTGEVLVDTGTPPPPDGYGKPSSTIHPAFGIPDLIGDEDLIQLLGEPVQKYGRTTRLTSGTIDSINATVNVCYDQACSNVARFADQIIIIPGSFSGGGDSGSLIVTNDANKYPVGLLFAGSDTQTIANRIDLVLNRFGVDIDSGPAPTLESIVVEPEYATVEQGGIYDEFIATGHYSDSSMPDLTQSATWESLDPDIAIVESPGVVRGIYQGTARIRATQDGLTSNTATLEVTEPVTSGGPHLRIGTVTASSDGWTTVTVDPSYTYEDMVVICTPHYAYDGNLTSPAVVRIQNAGGNSFDVGLATAVFWLGDYEPPRIAEVHWMAVEAGVYNEAEHGVKMEAAKFISTVTDNYKSWVGQSKTYGQAYTNPVVVGQVMTYNADRPFYWSVFWSRGSSASSPPSSGVLRVGKHQGQDNRLVNDETIGYVVIEAGSGSIEGTSYVAALGSDTIGGIGNNPPYRYSLSGLSNPTTAIASQAGMDGKDGGWAILHGDPAVTQDWVEFCIDEDWYWDSERRHTTEQVGYIVFE